MIKPMKEQQTDMKVGNKGSSRKRRKEDAGLETRHHCAHSQEGTNKGRKEAATL